MYWSRSPSGERLYRSDELESLWRFGFSSVGALTFESAAYVARYCTKKVTGPEAKAHYARKDHLGSYSLVPEFAHMSLKPGIGYTFLQKYFSDIYPRDYCVVREHESRVPRYYDRVLKKMHPDMLDQLKADRVLDARQWCADNTPARLKVKEEVAAARSAFLKRVLC